MKRENVRKYREEKARQIIMEQEKQLLMMQERDELVNVINSLPTRTKRNIRRRFFKANHSLDLNQFRSIQHNHPNTNLAIVENNMQDGAPIH